MRAVIDTSILVRAVINPDGPVWFMLDRLSLGAHIPIYSRPLLAELVDVLRRQHIARRYRVTDTDIIGVAPLVRFREELVVPQRRITVCRDPDDNMVLVTAVAGGADVIVSGDEDLLVLNPFEGIPIVGPAAYLRRLWY